jgi:hypothetical protein
VAKKRTAKAESAALPDADSFPFVTRTSRKPRLVLPTSLAAKADKTHFADRVLNCKPSRVRLNRLASPSAVRPADIGSRTPPQPKNYLSHDWPVGDQGMTGACVGWAVGDGLLRWHFVQRGLMHPKQLLSARYLWMAAKEIDEFEEGRPESFIESAGTSIAAALRVARELGCALESVLPFSGGRFFEGSTDKFYKDARRLRIRDYEVLPLDPHEWKAYLSEGRGPLAVRVLVNRDFLMAKLTGRFRPTATENAHAVSIVGFKRDENGVDRFVIRNSWGTKWGDNGFALADEEFMRGAVTECFGVVMP